MKTPKGCGSSVALAALGTALALALPAAPALAGGWQANTTLVSFSIEPSTPTERIYVRFAQAPNPDNCTSTSPEFVRLYTDTSAGRTILSMLIALKSSPPGTTGSSGVNTATARPLAPYLSGCDDWGRPVLLGLHVQ